MLHRLHVAALFLLCLLPIRCARDPLAAIRAGAAPMSDPGAGLYVSACPAGKLSFPGLTPADVEGATALCFTPDDHGLAEVGFSVQQGPVTDPETGRELAAVSLVAACFPGCTVALFFFDPPITR